MNTHSIKTVTYPNLGWQTAADIYFPAGFDESRKYPAIVSTHPIGSCKEQTAGNVYAKGLAEQGFVVLVHDASFQCASGGEPRFIEDPSIRVSDIR
ncbi:MAG TPA: alpha/beta hydrolase, partial [Stenotrophomonas sp.]|nr:alpha/beta hydrolase [Stenotrophomonas sp.]